MYKISVPVMNKNFERAGKEELVRKLKSIDAQRVFLALDTYETDVEKQKIIFSSLKENTEFLKKHGFEVGAWVWTYTLKGDNDYVHMKFTSGNTSDGFICPSDENFRRFAGNYIKDIAKCGVDIIMYDDDYRYGFLDSGLGCVCENHIEYMENILGEKLPENVIDEYLISGSENKYRSAWLEANRYFMLKFAEDMRKCLDEINPAIRFGACSCMSVWDFDGTDSIEISKQLAGKTKPFLRLIGAPYWAVNKGWGNRLQDVIELERMELAWCADEDIEIFGEGDVYPRPRFNCPASYLEGFDTALRADGSFDGILKYAIDYTSNANYENGYVKRHIENKEIYKEIEAIFGNKKAVGVRVYESMKKFEHMSVPKVAKNKNLAEMFFSPAARMLASCSIPTVYEGNGLCGIVFGENAKYIPDEAFKNGLIIDARAAEILVERGIDVGIESRTDLPLKGTTEYFSDENEYVPVSLVSNTYNINLKPGAKVQSYFVDKDVTYPASYIYENADGQRFFVFGFDGYFMHESLYRQYTRSRQLAQNIKWLSGNNLSAYISGNPDLYVMNKSNGKVLAVGLWNFFEDYISEPIIKLDKKYSKIRFLNCVGKLEEDTVYLSKIQPYEFVAFEVE
jgi:hypothetical protein